MASYGTLLRKITTAEINRVQREGNFQRWAYFIDESTAKVGVVFANDTTFAALTVADEPDPKLQPYGLEKISDLVMSPHDQLLVLAAGDNLFQAVVFSDLTTVLEDDFLPSFTFDTVADWQSFMRGRHVAVEAAPISRRVKLVFVMILIAIACFIVLAVFTGNLSPGFVTGH